MLDLIKKQTVGTWITLGTLILAIVSAIIYGVGVGSAGYFKGDYVVPLVVLTILAILFLAAIIVLPQFKFEGILGMIIDIVLDVLKIAVPILLGIAVILFIDSRVEGLAFIYFSNEDVLAVIQTPENMFSASNAITTMVMYFVTIVAACVAAFFGYHKKDKSQKTSTETAQAAG